MLLRFPEDTGKKINFHGCVCTDYFELNCMWSAPVGYKLFTKSFLKEPLNFRQNLISLSFIEKIFWCDTWCVFHELVINQGDYGSFSLTVSVQNQVNVWLSWNCGPLAHGSTFKHLHYHYSCTSMKASLFSKTKQTLTLKLSWEIQKRFDILHIFCPLTNL